LYHYDESEIVKRGVCWSTEENPSISDGFSFTNGGLGQFLIELNDLETNTEYYAKAVFEGAGGEVFYSDQLTFKSAAGSFMDQRDGNVYGYQRVGAQNWMVDNLAYLPRVDGKDTRYNVPSYHVYDYRGNSVQEAKQLLTYDKYGVLYTHLAASAACPENWYLPSDIDWKVLERNLGMDEDELENIGARNSGEVGQKLKSSVSWFDNSNGNNSSGLNFLASGGLDDQYEYWPFLNEGTDSYYWSSPDEKPEYAYFRSLSSGFPGVVRYSFPTGFGFSVRCFQYTGNEPVIETRDILKVLDSEAFGGGTIVYPGEEAIISAGLCWSTKHNPTIDDQYSSDDFESGQFDSHISGLSPNTKYYARAYASRNSGTTYGSEQSFYTADGSFIDQRDSSKYCYVEIGSQIWMGSNLAYLPFIGDSTEGTANNAKYYVYGYEGSDIDAAREIKTYIDFGTYYNWEAARAACPEGWHLPSDEEWKTLEIFMGMSQIEVDAIWIRNSGQVGKKLKSKSGWFGKGVNSVRFNALRSGNVAAPGCYYEGYGTGFWSSSRDGASNAWYRGLTYSTDGVIRIYTSIETGFPVRCLRDQ